MIYKNKKSYSTLQYIIAFVLNIEGTLTLMFDEFYMLIEYFMLVCIHNTSINSKVSSKTEA